MAAHGGPDVVSHDTGDSRTSTLLGVDNLVLVRGERELMARAERWARLGHDSEPMTEEDVALCEQVSAALREVAPYGPPDEAAPAVTQLNIGNTYHCNMGCSYCYNELSIKDRKGSEVLGGMSLYTAKAMVDALVEQSGGAARLSLAFVGGEPLLEKQTLAWTVDYARERAAERGASVDVAVYTNGTLMNRAVIEWANEKNVSLVVSLDGPPLIHDRKRVYLNGRPTSHAILRNIGLLMEHSEGLHRRVRAVASEGVSLVPLHRYLLDLGFNEIHVQPMYDERGVVDSGDQLAQLLEWYGGLLRAGTVVGVMPFEGFLERLALRRGAITSWYPCTAGRSALGVGPTGLVYPCHHFLEEGSFQLGDVRDGLPSPPQRRRFYIRVDDREPCSSCWARHVCGGECYHRATTGGSGYTGVLPDTCRRRKSLIGLTLDLFCELASESPDTLRRLVTKSYTDVPTNPVAFEAEDLSAYMTA